MCDMNSFLPRSQRSALLICDIQEKFRPNISFFPQVSISSTLKAQILHTNVLPYVHQSQNITRKAAKKKDFCTKNLFV